MAKKAAKTATKPEAKPVKKAAARKTSQPSSADLIEKACEDALAKLKALNVATDLQAEIQWCLGSYRNDKNPAGLYVMAKRALEVFNNAVAKNAKSVPKKLLTDIEKVLKSR